MSNDDLLPQHKSASLELIIYQIGQLDKSMVKLTTQFSAVNERMDGRVRMLEMWRERFNAREKAQQTADRKADDEGSTIDWQKIVLGLIGITTTAIALAYGLVQGGVVKP